MTQASAPTATEAHFLQLVRDFDTATLITRGRADGLCGRPMAIANMEGDGTLWFLTDVSSAKVAELGNDPRAMVSLAKSSKFVIMNGSVEVIRDAQKARAFWKEPFRVWFAGPDDPSLTLLRFSPKNGEYWDNAGTQGLKYAFRAAKAYVTGEQLKGRENDSDPKVHGRVGG